MDMHEYNERVKEENRVDSEFCCPAWDAIEHAYIALDLHKDLFCKFVNAVGLQQIVTNERNWRFIVDAIQEKHDRALHEQRKARLHEIREEIALLQNEYENISSSMRDMHY